MIKNGNIGLVSSGFEAIRENSLKYVNNPFTGYLNIKSLRNKIVDMREIIFDLSFDYHVLSETKIGKRFPTAQFYIKGYQIRARRDRDKHGGRPTAKFFFFIKGYEVRARRDRVKHRVD